MKTNAEIRREARTVMKSKWLWRLATVGLCLYGIQNALLQLLDRAYAARGICKFSDYWQARMSAWQQGLEYSLPSASARWQMVGSMAFELFVTYVFASIAAYGFARALLKSTSGKEERWFADSFEGFRRPLETTWLMALMNIKVTLWSLLLFFPGIIALYRYRLAWYLKSENPEWSAGQCLKESGKLMRGNKWRAFALDFSYCGWLLLAGMTVVAGLALSSGAVGRVAIGSAISSVGMFAMMIVLVYLFVGRTVFYGEIRGERDKCS